MKSLAGQFSLTPGQGTAQTIYFFYSSIRQLVGLVSAALNVRIPTVSQAIINAVIPAIAKYHHCISILKAKLFNQD